VASLWTGVVTWVSLSSLAASAANAFVIWDLVGVATGSVGSVAGLCEDCRRIVVQPASSTLGGAAGGTTLGGGAAGVAVDGALICFAACAVSGCVLVACSSAHRASMVANWSDR
jgi:hypothetical protein